MKYDALTLQFFQEALENIKDRKFDEQLGICDALDQACFMAQIRDFCYDHDIINWMQKNYMPYKGIGEFWWPTFRNHESTNNNELIQSKADRIAFLERIIEDLMCGE
jgi:hypothetical protein